MVDAAVDKALVHRGGNIPIICINVIFGVARFLRNPGKVEAPQAVFPVSQS